MDSNETLDVTVDPNEPDEGVIKVVGVVKPHWKPETIKKEQIQGGTVNVLYKCWDTRFNDAIVIRIFGEALDQYLDKEEEIKVYKLLGELESGPKLLCVFKNGMCIEFIYGKSPSLIEPGEQERGIKLARAFAREIAVYHCQKTTKLAIEKFHISPEIRLYSLWQQCLDEWHNWSPELKERFPIVKSPEFPTKEIVQAEIEKLKKITTDFNLPLVLCHNDLHPGNSIYDEEKDKATLLDLEFASFYFAPFDLAFYLLYSTFGIGVDPSPEPHPMHPVEFQREFVRAYLEALGRLDNWSHDITDNHVEEFREKVDVFLLLVMLVHIPVLLMLASKPAPQGTDELPITWGCLKVWKAYLIRRKKVLGY